MAVHPRPLLLVLLLLPAISPSFCSSMIGINYGQVANNLPSPDAVIPLLRSIVVSKVKIYDADPTVLHAFGDSGVEFVVGLADECVAKVCDPNKALAWVKTNISPFIPRTKVSAVTVGNEVLTGNNTALIQNLLPAMQSIHSALAALGLDKQVVVTTAHSLAVLETSYPPSAGSFRKDLKPYLSQILDFHAKTGSPFLINAYPYFAYKADPKRVALDYVLFQPNQGVMDPISNLRYENMLHAQVDAVYSAIDRVMGKGKGVEVVVSETGWPSNGDADEAGATAENARKYNGNLIRLVSQKKGTPIRPGAALQVYVFALFNENQKPGPASERNYGLFKPDGTPAYQLGIKGANSNRSGGGGGSGDDNSGGGGGDGGIDSPSPPSSSSTGGYYTISSASKVRLCSGFGYADLYFFLLMRVVVVVGSLVLFS